MSEIQKSVLEKKVNQSSSKLSKVKKIKNHVFTVLLGGSILAAVSCAKDEPMPLKQKFDISMVLPDTIKVKENTGKLPDQITQLTEDQLYGALGVSAAVEVTGLAGVPNDFEKHLPNGNVSNEATVKITAPQSPDYAPIDTTVQRPVQIINDPTEVVSTGTVDSVSRAGAYRGEIPTKTLENGTVIREINNFEPHPAWAATVAESKSDRLTGNFAGQIVSELWVDFTLAEHPPLSDFFEKFEAAPQTFILILKNGVIPPPGTENIFVSVTINGRDVVGVNTVFLSRLFDGVRYFANQIDDRLTDNTGGYIAPRNDNRDLRGYIFPSVGKVLIELVEGQITPHQAPADAGSLVMEVNSGRTITDFNGLTLTLPVYPPQ